MDEYYTKYAKPIQKTTITEVKLNLHKWKNNLKDELDGLVYLKQKFNSGSIKIESSLMNKITDVITKLDLLIEKEIENISDFINVLDRRGNDTLDDKTYTKLELIRDNYNKILLNIHKMLNNSPDLQIKNKQNKSNNKNIPKSTRPEEDYQIDKEINIIQHKILKVNTEDKQKEKAQALSKISNKIPKTEDTTIIHTSKRNKKQQKLNNNTNKSFTNANTNISNINFEQKPNFQGIQSEILIIKEYLSKLESKLSAVENLDFDKNNILKMKEEHLKIETEMKLMTKDINELTETLGAYEKRIYLLEDTNNKLMKKNQILNEVIEMNIPGFNIDCYVSKKEKALTTKDKFSSSKFPVGSKPKERKLLSTHKVEDKDKGISSYISNNNNISNHNEREHFSNDRFFTNSFYENDDFHNKSSVEVQNVLKATYSSNNIKKERFLIPRK